MASFIIASVFAGWLLGRGWNSFWRTMSSYYGSARIGIADVVVGLLLDEKFRGGLIIIVLIMMLG